MFVILAENSLLKFVKGDSFLNLKEMCEGGHRNYRMLKRMVLHGRLYKLMERN